MSVCSFICIWLEFSGSWKMAVLVPKCIGLTMACTVDVFAIDYYYVIESGRASPELVNFTEMRDGIAVLDQRYARIKTLN